MSLRRLLLALALVIGLPLTMAAQCQTAPTEDRGGVNCALSGDVNCAPVDESVDSEYTLVIRNANRAPNIVVTCYGGRGYVSGRTATAEGEGGTSGGTGSIPDTRWDAFCATKKRAGAH